MEKSVPIFENHMAFPDRVNTEFVEVLDDHTLKMRVWERGSGETLACGTGACAVAVASILNGHVDGEKPVTVKLLAVIWKFSGQTGEPGLHDRPCCHRMFLFDGKKI